MPFTIIRDDITHVRADAIVNSANPNPIVGLGTDSRIHQMAGPVLLAARQKIGPIAPGCSAITPAFALQAKYVIHTVGPVWDGGIHGEETLLRSCYDSALDLAKKHNCRSVAFPLISTGNYGFPKDRALQIAVSAFSAFLLEYDMDITLVVFDRGAFQLSEKLFQNVSSYIDERYVRSWEAEVYGDIDLARHKNMRRYQDLPYTANAPMAPDACPAAPAKAPVRNLRDFLRKKDIGFTEALSDWIQKKGLKNATVYKRANISKQYFSKLLHDPHAKPTKPVAVALALALELDLEQTRAFIGRAGFALTDSSIFDLIICYFIENGNYNVIEINLTLYEFDQVLLGSQIS